MMTRREKLLIRPWQLRKYNNHKNKVINAVSIVDFGPPPERSHVGVKLKKLQKERERQMKIEEDNFKLLQHLSSIMRKKRVDNYWETGPPTFLSRVGIYHRTRSPTPREGTPALTTADPREKRRSRCFACSPQEIPARKPEERMPWEPPKKVLTRRQSRSALVPLTSDFDFRPINNPRTGESKKADPSEQREKLIGKPVQNVRAPSATTKSFKVNEPKQRIVLRQGTIQVALNFPSFADVKFVSGKCEKYLQRNLCGCTGFRTKEKDRSSLRKTKTAEIVSKDKERRWTAQGGRGLNPVYPPLEPCSSFPLPSESR